MTNKTKMLLLLIFLLFSLTSCTQTMKDKSGKIVKYEITGQTLTANILCKPTNQEVVQIYLDNGFKIDNLVSCNNFKITTGGYEGLWTSIFVKPLAFAILKIGQLVKNYGLGLVLSAILIRFLINPITKKTTMQSENMKKAKPELDKIEKKYKNTQDKDAVMQKTQEIMLIYKKYGINPMSGCLLAFIQLPLLIAFLEAINRIPAIFESQLLTIKMGTTIRVGLLEQGNILYGILLGLVLCTTYYSFKMTNVQTKSEQLDQAKMTLIFLIVFIGFASLGLPSAMSLYWTTSSAFTIAQNRLIKRRPKKNESISIRSKKS